MERARGRRQGRPLSLTPRALQRDDQAPGLRRLWSLGVRGLTRLAGGGRRRWAMSKTRRAGWSVGNPTRATAHPTADRLLEACQGLPLTIRREGRRRRRHLTLLARVQPRLLALLDAPVDIATRLCPNAHPPPSQ